MQKYIYKYVIAIASPAPVCVLSLYTHGNLLLADLGIASVDLWSHRKELMAKESL